MKPKAKNGTKGAAKSPAKTRGKDRVVRPSSSLSVSTGAAAPVAADAVFTDSPLLPSELRTRAAWGGILGRGAFFAQRIVTEWGDDWRSFEELARDVAFGAVVPPTAAEWSAFARRQMAEMDRETAYFDALEANDEKTARKIEKAGVFGECKMPEALARFDAARNAMVVYFWFYQFAEVRHVPDPVLSEIVQDASRGFARYRDAATERGRPEADKLFDDAMRYLERRLAQLLSDTDGRAAALSPAWDAVRRVEANSALAAAALERIANRKTARAKQLAEQGRENAPRRSEEEKRALLNGIRRMREKVERGQSLMAAARATVQEKPIVSERAKNGALSAASLKREYLKGSHGSAGVDSAPPIP